MTIQNTPPKDDAEEGTATATAQQAAVTAQTAAAQASDSRDEVVSLLKSIDSKLTPPTTPTASEGTTPKPDDIPVVTKAKEESEEVAPSTRRRKMVEWWRK